MKPATRAEIHRLAAEDVSAREIGRRVGVSHTTVAKVLRTPPPGPVAIPCDEADIGRAHEPAPPPVAPNTPALERGRMLAAELNADLDRARSVGDATSVQRLSRTIALLLPTLSRLEILERDAAAVCKIPLAEVDEIRQRARERIDAITARPLLCAHCSRQLSIQWGTQPEAEADA